MCHATVCIDNNDNDNLNRNSDNNSNNSIETGSGLRFDEKIGGLERARRNSSRGRVDTCKWASIGWVIIALYDWDYFFFFFNPITRWVRPPGSVLSPMMPNGARSWGLAEKLEQTNKSSVPIHNNTYMRDVDVQTSMPWMCVCS